VEGFLGAMLGSSNSIRAVKDLERSAIPVFDDFVVGGEPRVYEGAQIFTNLLAPTPIGHFGTIGPAHHCFVWSRPRQPRCGEETYGSERGGCGPSHRTAANWTDPKPALMGSRR
jgi:hypothetical protein